MSLCVSPSGVAFPIHRTFWVSKFAVVSLTVNVRLSDVVDFESLAAPTREPTRKLVKGLRTGKAKNLRNLENRRADYEDGREHNVYGILVHYHVSQKHGLG